MSTASEEINANGSGPSNVDQFLPDDEREHGPIHNLLDIQCSLEEGLFFFDDAAHDSILKNPVWDEFDILLKKPSWQSNEEQEAAMEQFEEMYQRVVALLFKATREQISNVYYLEIVTAQELKEYAIDDEVCSESVDECGMCKYGYKPDDKVGIIDCGHAFHYNCIIKWLAAGEYLCRICGCWSSFRLNDTCVKKSRI